MNWRRWRASKGRARKVQAVIDEHDKDMIRCRRLGHEVPFLFCRREAGDRPCRLIADCWWEQFDVQSFLREHFPEQIVNGLEKTRTSPPPCKILNIVEIIGDAQRRLGSDGDGLGPPSGRSDDD